MGKNYLFKFFHVAIVFSMLELTGMHIYPFLMALLKI